MFTDEERIAHLEEDLTTARNALIHVTGIDPNMFQRPEPGGTPVIVSAFRMTKHTADQALLKLDLLESERIANKLNDKEEANA